MASSAALAIAAVDYMDFVEWSSRVFLRPILLMRMVRRVIFTFEQV